MGALEAVRIDQREEQVEVLLLAVVRRGCQQKEVPGDVGKKSAKLEAFCVFDLSAPNGGGHLVCLIADNQIPLGDLELFLQGFIPRELIQPADTKVCLGEYITAGGGFDAVIGQNFKAEMKLGIQLVLPLFRQTAGRYDQTAFQVAAGDQLPDEQPGHDGLAGTGVIRQHKAQR